MALYGSAGPATLQGWQAIRSEWYKMSETRTKEFNYTVALPELEQAVEKKMRARGFKPRGKPKVAGICKELFEILQKHGGFMWFDGELPRPPGVH